VYGIELDIGGIGFDKRNFDDAPSTCTPFAIHSGLYGDVTGRLGYAFDRTLVYAKGGFAFSNGEASVANFCAGGLGSAKTDTFTGWTAGGGVEYSINPAWSLKIEYQHFDFGTEDVVLHLNQDDLFHNNLTADSVTVGANYHFATAYEPLK
jgi:outer membrane immunogenic protein